MATFVLPFRLEGPLGLNTGPVLGVGVDETTIRSAFRGMTMASYPSLKSIRRASTHDISVGWRELGGSPSLRTSTAGSPPLAFAGGGGSQGAEARRAEIAQSEEDLARMIESEIIPRLMLAHRPAVRLASETPPASVGPRTLDGFIRISLTRDANALTAFIDTLMEGGLPLEEVYADLLIPAARRLGEGWEDDTVSFTDVTLALSHLHQVVRMLAWREPPPAVAEGARAICLSPFPGSQHTFGLTVLEDGFRRAGWRTRLDPHASGRDCEDAVAADWFDVFGLGVASDVPLPTIAGLLARVRAASCNPDLFVMVGGALFFDRPQRAGEAGADATAGDTRDALLIADKAVRARAFG